MKNPVTNMLSEVVICNGCILSGQAPHDMAKIMLIGVLILNSASLWPYYRPIVYTGIPGGDPGGLFSRL